MPIRRTRPNWEAQLARASQDRLFAIVKDVYAVLDAHPEYAFTADELAARIDTPAAATVIEYALSRHAANLDWTHQNDTLYWHDPENIDY